MADLAITFHKGPARRYRSILRRADGVDVELEGGSWNAIGGPDRELPHDLAHLVVESELGLERGVWGVLAAGGLFRGATVVAGRRPPHADRRAREVLAASVEQLNQAEVITRAVCDLAIAGTADPAALRAATGERWWAPQATAGALARAFARLHRYAADWRALEPGGRLDARWPAVSPRGVRA